MAGKDWSITFPKFDLRVTILREDAEVDVDEEAQFPLEEFHSEWTRLEQAFLGGPRAWFGEDWGRARNLVRRHGAPRLIGLAQFYWRRYAKLDELGAHPMAEFSKALPLIRQEIGP